MADIRTWGNDQLPSTNRSVETTILTLLVTMVDHFSLYILSPGYHWGARPLSAGSPVTLHRALPPQLMNPYFLGCKFFFVSYGVLMCAGKRTLLVW